MDEPHDDVIVKATGAPARHARVLARAVAPDLVFGLVDTNGDERELEWAILRRESDGWRAVLDRNAGAAEFASMAGVAFAYGWSGDPTVTIEFAGHRHVVETSGTGWWAFAADNPLDAAAPPELATRISG